MLQPGVGPRRAEVGRRATAVAHRRAPIVAAARSARCSLAPLAAYLMTYLGWFVGENALEPALGRHPQRVART